MPIRFAIRPPTPRGLFAAVVLLLALVFTPMGRWVLVPKPEKADAALDLRMDDIRFEDVPLQDAIQAIGKRAGFEISMRWKDLYRDLGFWGPVTLHLRNVSGRSALEASFAAAGIDVDRVLIEGKGSLVEIGVRNLSHSEPTLRLYDLNSLIDAELAGEIGRASPRSREEIEETLTEQMKRDVHSSGRRSINAGSGRIAILTTPEEHLWDERLLEMISHDPSVRSGAAGVPDPRRGAIEVQLGTMIGELDLRDVSLRQALERLHELTSTNVVLSADADLRRRFSLDAHHITAEQGLDMILSLAEADTPARTIQYHDEFVVVSFETGVGGVDHLYNVRDLIDAISDEGRQSSLPTLQLHYASQRDDALRALVTLMDRSIESPGWQTRGRDSRILSVLGDRLLVHATPSAHRRIARRLNTLRNDFGRAPVGGLSFPESRPEEFVRIIGVTDPAADLSQTAMPKIDDLRLEGVTIIEALQQITSMTHIRIAFENSEIAAPQVDLKSAIHLSVRDVSLDRALRIVFDAVSAPGTVSVSSFPVRGIVWIRTGPEEE